MSTQFGSVQFILFRFISFHSFISLFIHSCICSIFQLHFISLHAMSFDVISICHFMSCLFITFVHGFIFHDFFASGVLHSLTHCQLIASLLHWFIGSVVLVFVETLWFNGSFFLESLIHVFFCWTMDSMFHAFMDWLAHFSWIDCFTDAQSHVAFHWLTDWFRGVHWFIGWLFHWVGHSCADICILPLTQSFTNSLIHSSLPSFISFIHSFLPSFIHFFLKFISFRRAWFAVCQLIGISTTIIRSFGDTLRDFNMSEHCFCISKAFYRPLMSIVKKASNQPVHWDATA